VRAALSALLLLQAPAPGALDELAAHLTAQARAAGAESPVVLAVSAGGHSALGDAFSRLLLSRLAEAGLSAEAAPPGTDGEALARAHGARTLLRVRLLLAERLLALGDVSSTWRNFFSGRDRSVPARPTQLLFGDVAADAAVRALAAAEVPGLQLAPEPLARWAVRTAALAAGDLKGDGASELVVLTEEAVEVRAWDGHLLARRALAGLPWAALPSREPFGTLCVCRGLLYAFSASRAAGEVLALEAGGLVLRETLRRPVVACGVPLLEATFLPGAARLAPAGDGWPALPPGAAAWGLLVKPVASGQLVVLLREDGTATVVRDGGPPLSLPGVGAGAALVDGTAADALGLLAASSSAPAPAEDTLRLLALPDGTAQGGLQLKGRILQVATARAGVSGAEALWLGVWREDGGAELRLVRGLP
jgi:hypothetical protein